MENVMSLQDRLDAFKADLESGKLPFKPTVQQLDAMRRATAELIASGQAQRALKAGDKAPDFVLNDPDGKPVSSRDLLAKGPLVLSFYRGVWCPYCNMELQALQAGLSAIEARGASLVSSLIGRVGSSTYRLSAAAVSMSLTGSCFSSESALSPSIMGFEDEAEQSIRRPCRQTNGRSKRPNELTSSIVPRGTSFHRSVEFEFPPIAFDRARLSCRRDFGSSGTQCRQPRCGA
jgi:hypothetical protein